MTNATGDVLTNFSIFPGESSLVERESDSTQGALSTALLFLILPNNHTLTL